MGLLTILPLRSQAAPDPVALPAIPVPAAPAVALRESRGPETARNSAALAPDPDGGGPGTDAELAEACKRGEPGALERLVERFQSDVFGAAVRIVHDRDTALELANSIFYKVYRNLDAYDATRPLRPWLLRIATNETLNWVRARRRDQEHVVSGEAGAAALDTLSGGTDPEAAALAAEQREAVRTALARLPEHYRLILTLRFFHDLSYQEIAEHTKVDANTIGVQLLRARQLLKRELGKGIHTDG
jgi:RNA polymerase sigma-70 factor (ECF subfamily)